MPGDDRIDRGRRTDAQAEGQDRHERESLSPEERSQDEAQLLRHLGKGMGERGPKAGPSFSNSACGHPLSNRKEGERHLRSCVVRPSAKRAYETFPPGSGVSMGLVQCFDGPKIMPIRLKILHVSPTAIPVCALAVRKWVGRDGWMDVDDRYSEVAAIACIPRR